MILAVGATVAVADGKTIRLFRNMGAKPGVHLTEISTHTATGDHAGSGSRHHSGSANPDKNRLAENEMAAASASLLNKLSLDGTIEQLVLIADPRTLGEMRKHFHDDLRRKLISELHKNLTGRPVQDIADAIAEA